MNALPHDQRVVSLHPNDWALENTAVEIRRIDLEAPWRWIVAGWADMLSMPHISLIYGAIFSLVAVCLFLGLTQIGLQSIILALAGGFLLIGPILAVGLYEGSRRLERNEPVRLTGIVAALYRAPGQLSLLGLALLLIFLFWVQTAFLLFMVFMGTQPFPPLADFVSTLLLTTRGVIFLIVGAIEGAILAALVFTICAVSAPMLIDRPVGVTTAISASARAVWLNLKPMALWAALIAASIAIGLLTLTAGLIVVFPLIGHATWHAYREIVGPERDGH